ncbi:MAG: hypothetical protein IJW00_01135 [Clostridia bacterium]|nr:hypothetical protein [Clostridia bacterium]
MKKFLSLTLCLAVLLSCALIFAACDNSGKTNETEANTSAKTEAPTQAPADDATEAPTETPTEAPTEEVTDPDEDGTEDGTTDGSGDNGDYDPEYYVVINSAEDLMNFNKAVNEDGEVYFDMTIVLTDDIDLTGYTWVPLDGYAFDYTTFDGNGHTISNMEIVHEPEQGTLADQIGAGFVGVARGDIYFEDITFDNCKVTAYERAIGCLIGCVTGGTMSFENVNVKNFTVDGWMDYANQDRENGGHPISFRSAGFIGHIMAAGSSADFYNCHVDGIKLSGFHNMAGFIGYASQTVDEYCFEDCSVSNAEFTFSYCMSDSYTVDMPRKFVSVFYNAANWADNIDYCIEQGNTFSSVSYFDWTDDNKEYTAGEFRSWTREEADAAAAAG